MPWINSDILKTRIKLQRVAKIICNSEYTKHFIDRTFHTNSTVIYPPVEIKHNLHVKKENIILNVGRYGVYMAGSSYKKQEVLVEAFKELIKQGLNNWKLIFIVSIFEKDNDRLSRLIESSKGYPIEIISNPNNESLWEYYQKAKIYWHASGFGEDLEKNPDRAEHFGISTVEAMGSGAVPIVINAGGQKEIIKNGESGFLWNTEDELIKKTAKIIHDEALWKEMSINAMKRPEEFSIEQFCKKLNALIL